MRFMSANHALQQTAAGHLTKHLKILSTCACVVAVAFLVSMIDRVNPEGDHVSYLVIAPHPTLSFEHSGGEEGAWRHAHPGIEAPWWLVGRYIILMEVADS